MEAGDPRTPWYWWAQYWRQRLLTRNSDSSFLRLHRRRPPRRLHWWGTPGLRCGAEEREAGRSSRKKGGGRRERASAPRGWGCCWGSVWGWWPAACGPCPPSACASVEAIGKGQEVMWQEHTCSIVNQIPLMSKTKPNILTRAPSGPNICKKFPMNSLDFSSHFWMRSMLFSSTFCTNSLLFSSTSRTFLFTLSTRSCRWYFFS